MGCTMTKTQDEHNSGQSRIQTDENCVFVPGLRLPRSMDHSSANSSLIQRVEVLHSTVVEAAEALVLPRKSKRNKKSSDSSTGSSICHLRKALDDYVPVLLRLSRKEPRLSKEISFTWTNQEDTIKETTVRSSYYELVSALQLQAILCLLEANKALTFKPVHDVSRSAALEKESKKLAMDALLNAAQILEFALKTLLPEVPQDVKPQFPADLTESVLRALELQALAQTVEIQLGLAINNPKATMAVKRRLACELVKYWEQAWQEMQNAKLGNGWGDKHILFAKWKSAQAKAAAYYYHGLILNEGFDKRAAAKCLEASNAFFNESETYCEDFSTTAPMTSFSLNRSPVWGPMKYLEDKIPKDAQQMSHSLIGQPLEKVPRLPDFQLALEVEEYKVQEEAEEQEDEV